MILAIAAGSAALHSPKSALRMFDVFDGSNRPFFLKELMLKKAFSALLHSLPPLLPVTLPNIHRTTSHGSAANEGAEKPAVRHRSAAAIAVFFITFYSLR